LLSFVAVQRADKILFEWSTAWELNNDFFTVERSSDGVHYDEVDRVPAVGNSKSEHYYHSEDAAPYVGKSYYRLKQTDLNGVAEYLDVKAIIVQGDKNVDVFPNPFDGQNISVLISGLEPGTFQYNILDISGVPLSKGEIVIDGKESSTHDIKLSEKLSAGIYHLQLFTNVFSKTVKLVVR
jgi:hypothetical protein